MEEVKDCGVRSLIGGDDKPTFIAFKNPSSYLIITSEKGMLLTENDKNLYLAQLPFNGRSKSVIDAVVYADNLDCYFFNIGRMLYRKDLNQKAPIQYVKFDLRGSGFDSGFVYSKPNERLIYSNSNLYVLNLRTRNEIEVRARFGKLKKFKLMGKERVIGLCRNGCSSPSEFSILLGNLFCRLQTGKFVSQFPLNLSKEKRESVASFAGCQKNRYLFVEIQGNLDDSMFCSRMLIFDCFEDNLTLKASLDHLKENMGIKRTLHCAGYAKNRPLWVGLSGRWTAQIFAFDAEKEELLELKEKRVKYRERALDQIHSVGDDLYYMSYSGKLNKLRIGVE